MHFRNKIELMIQLSYKCNLSCVHCAYGDLKGPFVEIKPERVMKFLSRNLPELIKLSGGEPTLSPSFPEIVRICRDTGAKVVTLTNGTKKPRVNPDTYWVSLYGNQEFHRMITGINNYSKVISFIKSHDVEYLNCPVFSEPQMASLQYESEKLGIPLRITQLLSHGRMKLTLPLEEQRKIVTKLGLDKDPHWPTCSLGFGAPRCSQKACLKPDGTEVICTSMIRGLKCPYARGLET